LGKSGPRTVSEQGGGGGTTEGGEKKDPTPHAVFCYEKEEKNFLKKGSQILRGEILSKSNRGVNSSERGNQPIKKGKKGEPTSIKIAVKIGGADPMDPRGGHNFPGKKE